MTVCAETSCCCYGEPLDEHHPTHDSEARPIDLRESYERLKEAHIAGKPPIDAAYKIKEAKE